MTLQIREPSHIDEPLDAKDYQDAITRVAAEERPVVVRRNGADIAIIMPLAHYLLFQEAIAREEAERLTKTVDWKQWAKSSPPPQAWFDGDEPKPF